MIPENSVSLHKVDGDPRKMIAVRRLVKKYPQAIDYWHNSGITERAPVDGKEGVTKHKHGVLAHQFASAMVSEAIGGLLKDKGILTETQTDEVVLAALIHDADKTTDMAFIIMAMGGRDREGEVSWAKVKEIGRRTDLPNNEEVLAELRGSFEKYFDESVEIGTRVHVARALVAGRFHEERLKQAGFSPETIDIQGATEYTGCDEVDALLDKYEELSPEEKIRVIQKCIICSVDNGMKESEFIPVEERTEAVFEKKINTALSQAYKSWNEKGETAKDKQNRVGQRINEFLAGLIGVEPDNFLSRVEQRIKENILQLS